MFALEQQPALFVGAVHGEGVAQAALEPLGRQRVLVQIVGGPGLHQFDRHFLVPLSGQRDDRCIDTFRAQLAQQRDAVGSRQAIVEQHAVEAILLGGGNRADAIGALVYVRDDAGFAQQSLHGQTIHVVVVDQKDAEWLGHGRLRAARPASSTC
jgi:hypothetical protein